MTKNQVKFGHRIQKRRQGLGITQEELADRVSLSRTHMGHIEQGRRSPSLEVLNKIAKALKTSPKDFF
ncbi:TPA: transcriptional regulator [Candidatus Beckwithbacteria bacterium]|nr:transcriptional regulator [Candidatus Beckwithbacteria bacterium]HCE99762.1 transcriptional regulator [Candidatus Beckwithbacteria bacterium]HCM44279.1 transcriptional regulator [Candidatus Beckwithbacteria bacterium]